MWNVLLRGWNWCTRFRHRCGYGVHSPSDFYLITYVIYESAPYYAYKSLHCERKKILSFPHHREKVDKALFRLANYWQPNCIWEFGTGSGIETRYLSAACGVPVYTCSELSLPKVVSSFLSMHNLITFEQGKVGAILERWKKQSDSPELIHIAYTPYYEEVFEALLPIMTKNSCMIISYPYATKAKKAWWKKVIDDPRVGVTFDLYDIGLVFFDFKRVKEHRIVNFL